MCSTIRTIVSIPFAIAITAWGGLAYAEGDERPVQAAMDKLTEGMKGAHGSVKEWLALYGKSPATFEQATRPGEGMNSVTVSAAAPLLSPQEMLELVSARFPARAEGQATPKQWGKRGDVAVYFPAGIPVGESRLHYLTGKPAEQYIKSGGALRGFVNVGMPVEGYGSAVFAKNVALANGQFASELLAQSPVVKKALGKVARMAEASPELKAAAARGELSDGKVLEALHGLAASDPRLASALSTHALELTKPVAFVVHGFGGNDKHHYQQKFLANKAAKPSGDQVVAGKGAKLIAAWWKEQFKAGNDVRLMTANHCAGTYENADWSFHLEAELKKQDPKLAAKALRRMYALDLAAAANRPEGIHHRAYLGTSDTFGFLVSRTRAFTKATMVAGKGHMLNPLVHDHNPQELSGQALPIVAFAQAFPQLGAQLARALGHELAPRKQRIASQGARFAAEAQAGREALAALQTDVPEVERKWVPFKLAKATAIANVAVADAQVARAERTEAWRKLHQQLLDARAAGDSNKAAELLPKVKKARKAAIQARNGLTSASASYDLAPAISAAFSAMHMPSYTRVGSGELTGRSWVSTTNPLTASWEPPSSPLTVADAKRVHENAVEFARTHRKMVSNDLQYGVKGQGADLEAMLKAKYGEAAAPAKIAAAKEGLTRANLALKAQLTAFYLGRQGNGTFVPGVMMLENVIAGQRGYAIPHPELARAQQRNPVPNRNAQPRPRPRRAQ